MNERDELIARLTTLRDRVRADICGPPAYALGIVEDALAHLATDREDDEGLRAAVMTVYSDPHLTWAQARAKLAAALTTAMPGASAEAGETK